MCKFETVTGPAFLASYFVNGDDSDLSPRDNQLALAWLEREGVKRVISVEDDSERFTWSYRLHAPEFDADGGTVAEYLCEMED